MASANAATITITIAGSNGIIATANAIGGAFPATSGNGGNAVGGMALIATSGMGGCISTNTSGSTGGTDVSSRVEAYALGGAATDIANGDLPGNVQVLKEYPYGARLDEGRAMLQIVHDVAPQANLAFRTGFISAGQITVGNIGRGTTQCIITV